jgi:hypothetical protein
MGNMIRTMVVAFLAGIAGAYVFVNYGQKGQSSPADPEAKYTVNTYEPDTEYRPNVVAPSEAGSTEKVDFSEAAAKAIPSVVYINSISQSSAAYSHWD